MTVLTLSVLDWSGLAVAGVAAIVGAWGLAAQRATQPPHNASGAGPRAPLPWGLLTPLIVAAGGLGILFGANEVLIVAFTERAGQPGAAGVVLAIFSAGSLAAGVAVGAMAPPADPVHRLRLGAVGLAVFLAPLPFAPNTAWLAFFFLLAGLTLSPTLITAVHLVELSVPGSRLTEALTWTTTGMSAGTAIGAAASGYLVDHLTVEAGFVLPVAAALMVAAVALLYRTPTPTMNA